MTNKGKKYKTTFPKITAGRKPLGGGWVEIRGKSFKARTAFLSVESERRLIELAKENGISEAKQLSNDINKFYEGNGK